jgi:hypothetical protein
MHDLILAEIIALPVLPRRARSCPRAVKRKMSNFPTKSRAAASPGKRPASGSAEHIRVVAPPEPDPQSAPPPQATSPTHQACHRRQPEPSQCQKVWKNHIRSWRNSGQTRAV